MSIRTTGNPDVDTATAEVAVALRDASPGKTDQYYYDEAMRLRDVILEKQDDDYWVQLIELADGRTLRIEFWAIRQTLEGGA
jgi:hypothetical protein